MKQLLKEPLLHFLLTGVAIFGIYALVNPGSSSIPDKRVVVDEGRINNIIAMFEKKWNRVPYKAELQGLIKEYVLEEIYYRQALCPTIVTKQATQIAIDRLQRQH